MDRHEAAREVERREELLAGVDHELALAHQAHQEALETISALANEKNRIEEIKNEAYAERNQILALLARMALRLGWQAWVGQHPESDKAWDADWRTTLFIESPKGQLSWHFHDSERDLLAGLPRGPNLWDGHTTAEKYSRLREIFRWK